MRPSDDQQTARISHLTIPRHSSAMIGRSAALGTHSARAASALPWDDSSALYPIGGQLRLATYHWGNNTIREATVVPDAHHGVISALATDDSHVVSCDFDGDLALFSRPSLELVARLQLPTGGVCCVKSKHLALGSGVAAVVLEGACQLVALTATTETGLVEISRLDGCYEFAEFSPVDNSLLALRRNVPVGVGRSLTLREKEPFGYVLEVVRVGAGSLEVTGQLVLSYPDAIALTRICDKFIAISYRVSRRLTFVSTGAQAVLGSLVWDRLGNSPPSIFGNVLNHTLTPGVLMTVDPTLLFPDMAGDGHDSRDGQHPVVQLDLPERAGTSGDSWLGLERPGLRFLRCDRALNDFNVCSLQVSESLLLLFLQYEIVAVTLPPPPGDTGSAPPHTRVALFNITCIGCDCNDGWVAAGDFSGQAIVARVTPGLLTHACTVSTGTSVRSLVWHPAYHHVLLMGLFNSHIVYARVRRDEFSLPELIDDVASGAITCLRFSLSSRASQEAESPVDHSQSSEINQSESTVEMSVILLAGTTSGHVTLYRHCYVEGKEFTANFIKLTTILAHHPSEANADFGSLAHFAEVWSSAWSPVDQSHFVTCSEDQEVRVWSLRSSASLEGDGAAKPVSSPVFVLTGHRYAVTCLDWRLMSHSLTSRFSSGDSSQDSFLGSCSDDKTIRVYHVSHKGTEWSPEGDLVFTLAIVVSTSFLLDWHTLTYLSLQSGGSRLAAVTQHGYLVIFDLLLATVQQAGEKEHVGEERPESCMFSRKVANGSIEGLCWRDEKLCFSSADCCLNVKFIDS